MFDGEVLGAEFAEIVRGYVDKATEPLLKRIADLEAKAAEPAPESPPSLTAEQVRELIATAVAFELQALPTPEPGRDGKDVDMEAVARMVADEVAKIPPPKDGEKGDAGEAGKDGSDGRDGVGLAGAIIDRAGSLILTLTDGTTRELGQVVGRDGEAGLNGKDGADGRDGFSLEDFVVEMGEDGRTIVLKFARGHVQKTYELQFPIVLDAGVYKDGVTYQKGDGVTWGGSYWIAQKETSAKPGEGGDFRLATKKGRDGKDGKDGERGPEGKKGDPGRDGRSYS